jgi:hypothetical protein
LGKKDLTFFGFQDEPLKWLKVFTTLGAVLKIHITLPLLLGILHLKTSLHYSLSKRLKSYKSTFWLFEGEGMPSEKDELIRL